MVNFFVYLYINKDKQIMKKQLLALLEKANKLEDKFRNTKWETCKTHTAECKLSNDKDHSRKLRKTLEEALRLLECLEN